MTIRFLKPWNGYQPDAVVSGLTNEAALIAGGLASDDLDGGNDGRTYEAKLATDASGNVTGLVGPDGAIAGVGVGVALATGDAATDTASIDAAIEAAGENGIISFPAKQTYISWGHHVFKAGQKVNGNGSIIKRADQVSSLYAGASTWVNGGTSVTVADGSLFSVGQWVCITNGDGTGDGIATGYYDNTVQYTNDARITSINGNVLTLHRGLTRKLGSSAVVLNNSGSTYVVTCGGLIKTGFDSDLAGLDWSSLPTNILIADLVLDGNRDNNAKGRWWNISPECEFAMHESAVRGITIQNGMSDSIVFSGKRNTFEACQADTCSGNFFHPSSWGGGGKGTEDTLVTGCHAYDICKDATIGHSDGAYIFSANNIRLIYANNTVDTCGKWGLGSGFDSSNSDFIADGNQVKNCTFGAFRVNGGARAIIRGNVFHTCGGEASATSISTGVIEASDNVVVDGNIFYNSNLVIRNANTDNCLIANNTFHDTRAAGSTWLVGMLFLNNRGKCNIVGNTFTQSGATLSGAITSAINISSSADNILIEGNKFETVRRAVFSNNTTGIGTLQIIGNQIINPYDYGVYLRHGGAWGQTAVQNNMIRFETGGTYAGTAYGIELDTNAASQVALVTGNNIRSDRTSGNITLLSVIDSRALVANNVLHVNDANNAGTTNCISATGTVDTTLIVANNVWDQAPSTLGTATVPAYDAAAASNWTIA